MKPINHSDYYNVHGFEAIDFIEIRYLNFHSNVIKYVSLKDGEDALTALKKAQWYLNREIQRLEDSK